MESRKILINEEPKSPVAEAYRTLRTNIQFSGVEKEIRSIVVTSSGASEGKTTTSCNLAVAFAQSGKTVLLVDADLRKPKLHHHFDISNSMGLTKVLLEDELRGYTVNSKIKNLTLLTAGVTPPNPSEMLGSTRMKNLLNKAKETYDMVIIDSPPVGYVTDASLLSSFVDGTILVVATGQTEVKAAQYAKQQLENVNANILGTVISKIPTNGGGYYRHHYGYYTGSSQFENKKKKGLFKRK